MNRIEVNIQTGEVKLLELTAEEIAAIPIPTQAQIDAQAAIIKNAADQLAAKQDAFVATVAGFDMAAVNQFVDNNFGTFTAAQKNFLKAVGKVCVIGARKL